MSNKIALFPGSFDPFTIGHKSLVDRALQIFDGIVIAVGCNENKRQFFSEEARVDYINGVYANDGRVKAIAYKGLTAELAKSLGINTIIRGVRNILDFEYEKNLADINKEVGGIETVFLVALPQYSFISSSMIRELSNNGSDVSKYLPAPLKL